MLSGIPDHSSIQACKRRLRSTNGLQLAAWAEVLDTLNKLFRNRSKYSVATCAAAALALLAGTWAYRGGASYQDTPNVGAVSLQNTPIAVVDTSSPADGATHPVLTDVAKVSDTPQRQSAISPKEDSAASSSKPPAKVKSPEDTNEVENSSSQSSESVAFDRKARPDENNSPSAEVRAFADRTNRAALSDEPSEANFNDSPSVLRNDLPTGRFDDRLYNNVGVGPDLTGSNPGTKPLSSGEELKSATKDQPYCETLPSNFSPLAPFSLSSGIVPKGLTLNKENGSLCGTPTETGIFRFEITSKNKFGDLIRATYKLVVAEGRADEANSELRITTTELTVGFLGSIYSFQLAAEGGIGSRQWTSDGLPDGLELDATSGVIGGAAEIDGEFTVNVTVRDSEGKSAQTALPLVIRTTPVFITTSALTGGQIGKDYQERLSAQGGVPPYSWSITQGALPPGLVFTAGTGAIDGTPTDSSEERIRFQVTDAAGKTDAADLELKISASDLQISTPAVAEAFNGQPYSFALSATGGVPPYSWRLSSGDLPSGLIVNSAGTIIGETTVEGEFRLTVSVTDQTGSSDKKRYSLRVQPDPDPASSSSSSDPAPTGGDPNPIDSSSSSTSSSSSGDPNQNQLPTISRFRAVPSDGKVGLSWKNPNRSDFIRVVIVRSVDHQPSSIEDGDVVYNGIGSQALDGGVVPEPGTNAPAPANGVTHLYSAFVDYGALGITSPSPESEAAAEPQKIGISGKPDPYIDSIASFSPLDPACYNCNRLPDVVLGPPVGGGEYAGSLDVVSLGAKLNTDQGASAPYGGSIVVSFDDNIIVNGSGADFVIFENALRIPGTDNYFIEPATVEVSVDGVTFYRFPFDFVPHFDSSGQPNLFNPFDYAKGFAGVHPVYSTGANPDPTKPQFAGGDAFDLSDIPGVDLKWISYVRLTATGDSWLFDSDGDAVLHSNAFPTFGASGRGNSGFDLDAAAAIHY